MPDHSDRGFGDVAPRPESGDETQHKLLLRLVRRLPTDFPPFGVDVRHSPEGADYAGDCSCGCRHYLTLDGPLGADWGVCANPASERHGLLTFEHQGCKHVELLDE